MTRQKWENDKALNIANYKLPYPSNRRTSQRFAESVSEDLFQSGHFFLSVCTLAEARLCSVDCPSAWADTGGWCQVDTVSHLAVLFSPDFYVCHSSAAQTVCPPGNKHRIKLHNAEMKNSVGSRYILIFIYMFCLCVPHHHRYMTYLRKSLWSTCCYFQISTAVSGVLGMTTLM